MLIVGLSLTPIMKRLQKIHRELQRLVAEPDWCFAIGLRIRFNHPTLLYQTYPEDWLEHYARNGLLFVDPAVGWGMTHTGLCDWSDLASNDTAGVLKQAADHGLSYGIAVSVGDATTRSLGFFASTKAPITPRARKIAVEVMTSLHDDTEGVTDLAPAELAKFSALNDGLRPPRT